LLQREQQRDRSRTWRRNVRISIRYPSSSERDKARRNGCLLQLGIAWQGCNWNWKNRSSQRATGRGPQLDSTKSQPREVDEMAVAKCLMHRMLWITSTSARASLRACRKTNDDCAIALY
jgi:hypothetical protein